jgi:hypothetical protein
MDEEQANKCTRKHGKEEGEGGKGEEGKGKGRREGEEGDGKGEEGKGKGGGKGRRGMGGGRQEEEEGDGKREAGRGGGVSRKRGGQGRRGKRIYRDALGESKISTAIDAISKSDNKKRFHTPSFHNQCSSSSSSPPTSVRSNKILRGSTWRRRVLLQLQLLSPYEVSGHREQRFGFGYMCAT